MRSFQTAPIILLALGFAFGQFDFSTQPISASALSKVKKANLSASPLPEVMPRVASSGLIREEDYIMGPGDMLSFYLGGNSLGIVSPEGTVAIPGVAPVKVAGNSLARAKADIKKALAVSYDTSKVQISLANANTFKISVLGEVMNPGLKIVTSYTRVEDLVAGSGGFTRNAIRSRLLLVHMAGDTQMVELARHFRAFADADNPLIKFGDKLIVSRVDFANPYCVVRAGGDAFFHQIEGEETLQEVYFQVSNYTQTATPAYVRVKRAGGAIADLGADGIYTSKPASGDSIDFKKEINYVFVGGAVLKPGMYEFASNYSAADYLYFAGLTPMSADAEKYSLVRDGREMGPSEVGPNGVRPGDKIYLARSKVDATRDYLSIFASLAAITLSAITLYFTFHN